MNMTKDWKRQWWLFCCHGRWFLVSRGSAGAPGAVCTHSSLRGFRRDTSMVISLGLSPFTTEQMMWYIRSSSPTWSTTSQELCEESSNQTCFLPLCLFIGMISFLTSISTCPAVCPPSTLLERAVCSGGVILHAMERCQPSGSKVTSLKTPKEGNKLSQNYLFLGSNKTFWRRVRYKAGASTQV